LAVRSRYEGPDLEALLEQVRTELGSGTKIVSANKIRSGGIAGFFARERYEVIVEHDGTALITAPPAADEPESVRPRDLAPSLLDLVDQVSAQERAAAPRISTESEPFAAVMDRMARNAGMPAPPAAAAQDADDVDDADIEDAEVAEAPAPVAAPAVAPAPRPAAPAPTPADTLPAPIAAAPQVPAAATNPVTLPTGPGHSGALVKLGLPAAYVPAVPSPAALEAALRSSLGRLPSAPPLPKTTGSVVAVVGERQAAMKIARDLAAEAGLDPDGVTIATRKRLPARTPIHLTITDTEDAAEKRRSWRRRDRPSVVVVDAELGGDKPAWAFHVLAALEPEATWGVGDATRKTEDVAAWMHGLGGVDALAVNAVDATVSPASVLQLDVPVGRLDGRPASPALWAALLTERLAA
jgi:hypothetical protein